MLNSRYAPVVALAVLGIIMVALLGWFLAISPKLSEASAVRAQASEVEDNTQIINASSDALDEYQALLDAAPDVTGAIALHAPNVFDTQAVRTRLSEAITTAQVEVSTFTINGAQAVPGIETDPASLISNQVAALFAAGPVHQEEGAAEFSPAVTPANEIGPVVEELYSVPVTMMVVGHVDEIMGFFTALSDPDLPIFQVTTTSLQARQADSGAIIGVSEPEDGDVIATITGNLYVLAPEAEILDEEALTEAILPSDSPFLEVSGVEPQPGAN